MVGRDGFGLVELTVAAALLSVGLALGLGAAARGLTATRLAHARERAWRTAAQVADSLAHDPAAGDGSRREGGMVWRWTVQPGPTSRYIEVTVSEQAWPDRAVTLGTHAAPPLP